MMNHYEKFKLTTKWKLLKGDIGWGSAKMVQLLALAYGLYPLDLLHSNNRRVIGSTLIAMGAACALSY